MEYRQALSKDGYIIAQSKTGDIPYAARTSDRTGCGWIAAYNFIKATGGAASIEDISAELGRGSLFGGRLGTGPLRLWRYLKRRGCRMRRAFTRKSAVALAQKAGTGILLYRHRQGMHFVTFVREADGSLRFLNAIDGKAEYHIGFEDFLARHARRFPIFLITEDEQGSAAAT